jgi:ubiquinone biosynthesis monooxygenase Coq7
MQRRLSFIDKMIANADQALRTLVPSAANATQSSPAENQHSGELDEQQRLHIAGLMRINHTGEVCAQALYQGQALTAKLPHIRQEMELAAEEEIDHLVWCEQRINELGGRASLLNPLFYAASFAIGATAGFVGDKWSLGFVAATEDQVCKHLQEHLEQLPEDDDKTRAILERMLKDEEMHGIRALEAGGQQFSPATKKLMTVASKLMTKTAYRV